MSEILRTVLNMSFSACFLIAVVMFIRKVFRKIPRSIICFLWLLVGIRLLCPINFESMISLVPTNEIIPQQSAAVENVNSNSEIGKAYGIVNTHIDEIADSSVQKAEADFMEALGAVWAVGVSLFGVYALASLIVIKRKIAVSVSIGDNIMLCDSINSPFVFGIIKPKIYVPSDISGTDLDAVVAHEKSHIKRLDHIKKPVGFFVLAVH